jgi:Leucine-rich repeat (LRR) protein
MRRLLLWLLALQLQPLTAVVASQSQDDASNDPVFVGGLVDAVVKQMQSQDIPLQITKQMNNQGGMLLTADDQCDGGTLVSVDDIQRRLKALVEFEVKRLIKDQSIQAKEGPQKMELKIELPSDMAALLNEPLIGLPNDVDNMLVRNMDVQFQQPTGKIKINVNRKVEVNKAGLKLPASAADITIVRGSDSSEDRNKRGRTIRDGEHASHNNNGGANQMIKERIASDINHEELLFQLGLREYPPAKCTKALELIVQTSSIRDTLPVNFLIYDCTRIVQELRFHQATGAWSERTVLEEFFFSIIGASEEQVLSESWKSHPLVTHDNWLEEDNAVGLCRWGGITCAYTTIGVGKGTDDNIQDDDDANEESTKLRHRNRCNGRRKVDGWTGKPCPPFDSVTKIDLTHLQFSGRLPDNIHMIKHLHRLNLMANQIHGSIPMTYSLFNQLEFLDLSRNMISSLEWNSLPTSLNELWLEHNVIEGSIPDEAKRLTSLCYIDVSHNLFVGSVPSWLGEFDMLNSLYLSHNSLTDIGLIQSESLRVLDLSHNSLSGKMPRDFLHFLPSLEEINLSQNQLTGRIDFSVTTSLYSVNITDNQFTEVGIYSPTLCDKGKSKPSFGCDVVACPRGTFSPSGSAGCLGPCITCEDSHFYGQSTCLSKEYLVGDVDRDGVLSQREVLNLFFLSTNGHEWGDRFRNWHDLSTSSCDLTGVQCNNGVDVTGMTLMDANMCSSKESPLSVCNGIPSEM